MPSRQTVALWGEDIPVTRLCGWGVWKSPDEFDHDATRYLVREQFKLWSGDEARAILYKKLHVVGAAPYKPGQRSMLWELGRKLLGTDPDNYMQACGDCVSFGCKNAIEYLQFFPLANGERSEWTMVFPPYLWGMGRLAPDCGNNRLGTEDGSVGAWQARAAMEYGSIPLKYEGVPEYSGEVARRWGNKPGPGQKWIDLGKQHIVKSAAAVLTWEDLVQAITNGYPVTVASGAGFEMLPRADGFHHRAADWGHQTCLIGVDDDPSDPYVIDLNSWGPDVHGILKDFKTGATLPGGVLRIRKADIMDMLAEQDSFAYSSSSMFPAQDIDRDKFNLW